MGHAHLYRTKDIIESAVEMLKRAGFEFVCASRVSEAAYYRFPGRVGLLRVAAHGGSKKKTQHGEDVVARLTFGEKRNDGFTGIHPEKVEFKTARMIGVYMMKTGTEPTDA